MIEAALTNNNIKHFIYSSVLHPSLRTTQNPQPRLQALRRGSTNRVRPTLHYPRTLPLHGPFPPPKKKILSKGNPVYPAPFAPPPPPMFPSLPFYHTPLHDLAEHYSQTTSSNRASESHLYATYQVEVSASLSCHGLPRRLSALLRRGWGFWLVRMLGLRRCRFGSIGESRVCGEEVRAEGEEAYEGCFFVKVIGDWWGGRMR